MNERKQPDRDPGAAPQVAADGTPQIDTPVIQMQDLEHDPGPHTRVNNKGVKVEPFVGELEEEDEKAREAVRKFEESLARLPPG